MKTSHLHRPGSTWRLVRSIVLAVGPVLSVLWVLSQRAVLDPTSLLIGVIVVLAAWSPLLPVGMHGLLCVDERAETLPWAPAWLRELGAAPAMLFTRGVRAETWLCTLGCATAWLVALNAGI